MHPEIEAFWEKLGYNISTFSYNFDGNYTFYIDANRCSFPTKGNSLMRLQVKDGKRNKVYLFDGLEYSEEEMLKIVKLTAFV